MHTLTFVVVLAVVGISRSSFLPWWHRLRVKTIVDKIVSVQTDSLKKHVMFFFFLPLSLLKEALGYNMVPEQLQWALELIPQVLFCVFIVMGMNAVDQSKISRWHSSEGHRWVTLIKPFSAPHNNVYNHSKTTLYGFEDKKHAREKSPATACVGTAGWPKEDVYNKQFFLMFT